MIGLVLAAGAGRRLRPHTDTLPKALVPVGAPGEPDSERSILEVTLSHFAAVGLTEAAIIVGYCGDAIRERQDALQKRYGLTLHMVDNDKAEEWNNAYSLWCARDYLARPCTRSRSSGPCWPRATRRTRPRASCSRSTPPSRSPTRK
jgi:choline kinase